MTWESTDPAGRLGVVGGELRVEVIQRRAELGDLLPQRYARFRLRVQRAAHAGELVVELVPRQLCVVSAGREGSKSVVRPKHAKLHL